MPPRPVLRLLHRAGRRAVRLAVRLAVLAAATAVAGACSTGPSPVPDSDAREASDALIVPPDRYDAVFDAAVDAAREVGLPPLVRDRSAGIIETEPRIAGSLFEPWTFGEESLGQAAENTLLFQRRRARIEFAAETPATGRLRRPDRPLPEPGVAGAAVAPLDLRSESGPLEVRVRVFVERAFVPNLKMNTYSRTLSTRYRTPLDPAEETWTPVGRDRAWEARILSDLGRRMSLVPVDPPGESAPQSRVRNPES